MSLSNPNNPLARLQETNEQTSNPFDVKIRRPGFKGSEEPVNNKKLHVNLSELVGFWQSNRKDKKEKKEEKKRSTNSKTTPKSQTKDETISINSQHSGFESNDFNRMMGSMEGLDRISSDVTKKKCVMTFISRLFSRLISPIV